MKTWTTTTFDLDPADRLTVVTHKDSVSLSLPGYMSDGRGFSLDLKAAHVGIIHQLLDALDALVARTAHTDHNPFLTATDCPACNAEEPA